MRFNRNALGMFLTMLAMLTIVFVGFQQDAHAQTVTQANNAYQLVTGNATVVYPVNLVNINLTAGNSTVTINTTAMPTGWPIDVWIGANGGATNSTVLNATSGTIDGASSISLATANTHYRLVFDGTNLVGK